MTTSPLEVRDLNGQTPLHVAAKSGATGVLRVYVKAGAVLSAKDNDGRTPLHLAVIGGDYEKVGALLKVGDTPEASEAPGLPDKTARPFHNTVGIDVRDASGRTAFCYAAQKIPENPNVVELLLEKGATISVQDYAQARAVLEHAIKSRRRTLEKRLIDQGVDGEIGKPGSGQRALGWALDYRNEDTLRDLVEHRADFNTDTGLRALRYASVRMTHLIKGMVQAGADVRAKYEGRTALYKAAERGDISGIKQLAELGADVNAEHEGMPALFAAIETRRPDNVGQLVVCGATLVEYEGMSVLDWAIGMRFWGLVGQLVEYGNAWDTTVLLEALQAYDEVWVDHAICWGGSPCGCTTDYFEELDGVLKILADRVGEDINVKDEDGRTALDLASELKLDAIVKCLQSQTLNPVKLGT